MPFPTVDGRSFGENLAVVLQFLMAHIGAPATPEVLLAFNDLVQQVEVVADQLYEDVQELERDVKGRKADPSQKPIKHR